MSLGARFHAAVSHSMRGYYIAIAGGGMLVVSAFLPWLLVGDVSMGGFPGVAALWVLGLGVLAMVLASLSIITRKNSRHPLLLVGFIALGILFLTYRFLERTAKEHAWATSQALAIVDQVQAPPVPPIATGSGLYVGITGAVAIILFGMTIIIRRVSTPYAQVEDDDI